MSHSILLAFVIAAFLFISACGVKGLPVAPERKVYSEPTVCSPYEPKCTLTDPNFDPTYDPHISAEYDKSPIAKIPGLVEAKKCERNYQKKFKKGSINYKKAERKYKRCLDYSRREYKRFLECRYRFRPHTTEFEDCYYDFLYPQQLTTKKKPKKRKTLTQ